MQCVKILNGGLGFSYFYFLFSFSFCFIFLFSIFRTWGLDLVMTSLSYMLVTSDDTEKDIEDSERMMLYSV